MDRQKAVFQALLLIVLIAIAIALFGIQAALEDGAESLDQIQGDTGVMVMPR